MLDTKLSTELQNIIASAESERKPLPG